MPYIYQTAAVSLADANSSGTLFAGRVSPRAIVQRSVNGSLHCLRCLARRIRARDHWNWLDGYAFCHALAPEDSLHDCFLTRPSQPRRTIRIACSVLTDGPRTCRSHVTMAGSLALPGLNSPIDMEKRKGGCSFVSHETVRHFFHNRQARNPTTEVRRTSTSN